MSIQFVEMMFAMFAMVGEQRLRCIPQAQPLKKKRVESNIFLAKHTTVQRTHAPTGRVDRNWTESGGQVA